MKKTDIGDYSEAINLLDDVIKLEPAFDSAYVERAFNNLQIDKLEKALEDANKAIDLNYKNKGAYFVRGMIYGQMRNFEKALKDYTHIIKLGDSSYRIVALRERASIYFITNEEGKAIRDYTEIIESDSLDFKTYVSRGLTKLRHDVYIEYSDSIRIASENPEKYNDFFKYFNIVYPIDKEKPIMYDTRGAIQDFNKAIKINPDYDYAYSIRAKVYMELNLMEKALSDINKAIKLRERSEYYVTRANIYKSLNDSEQSLRDFNKAIEIDPKNGFAYINRGYLKREQLNDNKGAEKDIKMGKKLGVDTE